MTRAMKRLKNGRLFLILTSDETSGHLTTGHAKFYKQVLQRLLDAVPRRAL
jgi:homoserine O-acetyltransferase